MNEDLNGWERLKKAFEGLEPDVSGNWELMKTRLDAAAGGAGRHGDYLVRRAKMAERFAFGATAVAAGFAILTYQARSSDAEEEQFATTEMASGLNPIEFKDGSERSELKMDHLHDEAVNLSAKSAKNSIGLSGELMARTSNVFYIDAESDLANEEVVAEKPRMKAKEVKSVSKAISTSINPSVTEEVLGHNPPTVIQHSEPLVLASSANEVPVIEAPESAEEMILLSSSVQEACAGTEVEFALRGITDEGSVLCNFGDGAFSQEDSPLHVYSDPGTYDITVSIRDHADGTIRTRSVENMIVVRPKPVARMNWSFESNAIDEASIKLINQTENASSSTWLLGDKGMDGSMFNLPIPGHYGVNLVVSNTFGCQDVKSETLHLGDRKDAIAPAVFSPDNDGRYDYFLPMITHECEDNWNLVIYDTDGVVAFESSEVTNPWDGTLKSGGTVVSNSSYRWELILTNAAGKQLFFTDQVKVEK